jgi:hypothetical protein
MPIVIEVNTEMCSGAQSVAKNTTFGTKKGSICASREEICSENDSGSLSVRPAV